MEQKRPAKVLGDGIGVIPLVTDGLQRVAEWKVGWTFPEVAEEDGYIHLSRAEGRHLLGILEDGDLPHRIPADDETIEELRLALTE